MYFFEAADAAALLQVDTKTLQRKREARARALASGEEPDPLDIASIEFVPPCPTVKYAAQALLDYLLRLSAASNWGRPAPLARVPVGAASAMMGFQSWLAEAGPNADWPFSMQPDGRPMDFFAAILSDKLTGEARRMTLRDFTNQASTAASQSFAKDEAAILSDPTVSKQPALDGCQGDQADGRL